MSCRDLKRKNAVLEEKLEHDKLKRYLNDLVDDNNVFRILAKREIGIGRSRGSTPYNLKNRRFIITGKKYFSRIPRKTYMIRCMPRGM